MARGQFQIEREAPLEPTFREGTLSHVSLGVALESLDSLRRAPRTFVPADLTWNGLPPRPARIRLKGSVGSFQPVDENPSLTLEFPPSSLRPGFTRPDRLHLNNSIEDPSRLHVAVASLVFRAAGHPTPSAGWARVRLAERDLGVYVITEGHTDSFLDAAYGAGAGTLFEPRPGSDVGEDLRWQAGNAASVEPFVRLADATLVSDLAERRSRLEQTLDLPRFLDFMALEVLLGHRDGYTMARNNYRVFLRASDQKVVFLPHGTDQLLGNPDLPWLPHAAGLVARAAFEVPEWRDAYRARMIAHHRDWFESGKLLGLYREQAARLSASLALDERRILRDELVVIEERVRARTESLRRQLHEDAPPLPSVGSHPFPLTRWSRLRPGKSPAAPPESESGPDGRPALPLSAREALNQDAWHQSVQLPAGRYAFEGRALAREFAPLPFGKHHGPALRVAGRARSSESSTPDGTWQNLRTEFEVGPPSENVELLCEFRAREGRVWFDVASLRLVRVDETLTP